MEKQPNDNSKQQTKLHHPTIWGSVNMGPPTRQNEMHFHSWTFFSSARLSVTFVDSLIDIRVTLTKQHKKDKKKQYEEMNDVGRIAPLPSSATSVAIHVLPAKIGHHGPAAVDTFFSPRVSLSGRDSYRKELGVFATQCFDDGVFASREHNGSESQVAFLRGRQIVSKQPHSFPGYTMYRTHTRTHTDGSHMLTFSSKAAAWQEWELPGMTKKPLSANIEAWIRLNKTIHESSTTASSSSISAS